MIEILPAILAANEIEFLAKLARVRALGLTLHIDVMDGIFVPTKTWAPPERMRELLEGITFEAHLMVSNPEHAVPVWLAAGASRVAFHTESTARDAMICRATADECKNVAIAVNPETSTSRVMPMIGTFERFMIMGVAPGRSGQPFREISLEKIREIKAMKSSLHVTVDGGVKPENVRMIADAGADAVVIGSALTDAEDAALALAQFRTALG